MKKLIDVLTVLLLIAAFGMAFYTGFIGENTAGEPMLKTNYFSMISIGGAIILYFAGMVSAMVTRAKRNLITISFLALSVVQTFALVGMCLIMCMIWSGMFPLGTTLIHLLYILFILVLILGYVDAVALSDAIEQTEAEDEAEDDDHSDDAYDDEEDGDAAEAAEDSDSGNDFGFLNESSAQPDNDGGESADSGFSW